MVIIVNNELIELITVLGNDENNNGFCTSENVERTGIFASTKSANRLEYYDHLSAASLRLSEEATHLYQRRRPHQIEI